MVIRPEPFSIVREVPQKEYQPKEKPKRKPIPGRSKARDKAGILIVKTPYLRIPYRILRSESFNTLSPLARTVYFIFLSDWSTHDPDEPVELSYSQIREKTKQRKRTDNGKQGFKAQGYTQITRAINELDVNGFIHVERRYKQTNLYWIEQKKLTG